LDDLFAALVLEIHVNVRRLAALFRDEALEEQPRSNRMDRSDAEHEADGGVRSATLVPFEREKRTMVFTVRK
jgi:hypothetical protein